MKNNPYSLKLFYITIDRRFLTPLRCVRNDALPHGGKNRESSASPTIPDSLCLSKRPSFRMERSEMRNLWINYHLIFYKLLNRLKKFINDS